jgi:hypothetical protein
MSIGHAGLVSDANCSGFRHVELSLDESQDSELPVDTEASETALPMDKARISRSTNGRVFHHKVPTMDIAADAQGFWSVGLCCVLFQM